MQTGWRQRGWGNSLVPPEGVCNPVDSSGACDLKLIDVNLLRIKQFSFSIKIMCDLYMNEYAVCLTGLHFQRIKMYLACGIIV